MTKRIFAGITVLAIGTIFAGQLVWARTTPTVEDGTQLQNFLYQPLHQIKHVLASKHWKLKVSSDESSS